MKGYFKLTAALAAFALLVVVMGLGTQNSVQAQTATIAETDSSPASSISYVCSEADTPGDGCAAADAGFEIRVAGATGAGTLPAQSATDVFNPNARGSNGYDPSRIVTIQNLDLATDTSTATRPEDRNPKVLYLSTGETTINVLVVRKSSGLVDSNVTRDGDGVVTYAEVADDGNVQVKGFHGHRIRISYSSGTGSIGTDETITVDDVKPTLVVNSPTAPLIIKGNTDITFSADLTDSLAGYTAQNTASEGMSQLLGTDGTLGAATNPGSATTDKGGLRMVVAGNVVDLNHTNLTKIDGGWRVSVTINSSALQNISPNVPWWIETRDRAGNTRRSSGTITGRASDGDATSISDRRFVGNLAAGTFGGTSIKVTREDANENPVVSNSQPIRNADTATEPGFAGATGTFMFPNSLSDPLFGSSVAPIDTAYTNPLDLAAGSRGRYNINRHLYSCPLAGETAMAAREAAITAADGVSLAGLTAESTADDVRSAINGGAATEIGASNTAQLADCGAYVEDEPTTYEILSSNLVTVDSQAPTLADLDVVTGKAYNSTTGGDRTAKNSIKLTFRDTGKADSSTPGSGIDAASVTTSAFSVSGNSVVAAALQSGGRVYLTLADDLGSTERPSVTVTGGLVKDKAGNAADGVTVDRARDGLGPNLTVSKSADLSNGSVSISITADEQLGAAPTVWITRASDGDGTAKIQESGRAPTSSSVGNPVATSDVRQTGALAFSVTMRADGTNDGEYSVFVRATDTNSNASTAGDAASSSTSKAFTFELDNRLNGGTLPTVTVADEDTVTEDGSTLEAEAVDPLIVTVDFGNEGRERGEEYHRDGYRTVELTSAKLKVSFDDGSSETKTFDLTTEVSTPDSIKFTIPILNPKIGDYELTLQARDSAGNVRTDSSGTTPEDLKATWEVISPKPVNIDLAPGWNLVSLPFQPANPAINSIIPSTHPADIVMTFDNASQVWLVARRDVETGLFTGDINVMTASTAYFIRTENFQAIRMLRPPLATAAAAPPPPPAITVVKGWNLVPIVSNDVPTPDAIAADQYFGTLGGGSEAGWLKALTFDTLVRTWISVTPGTTRNLGTDGVNPCTGAVVNAERVAEGTEPCQIGQYVERSTRTDDVNEGDDLTPDITDDNMVAGVEDVTGGADGWIGEFDGDDSVTVGAPVEVGKGYWLYSTVDGVIIP